MKKVKAEEKLEKRLAINRMDIATEVQMIITDHQETTCCLFFLVLKCSYLIGQKV